jgi:hypothetical protein
MSLIEAITDEIDAFMTPFVYRIENCPGWLFRLGDFEQRIRFGSKPYYISRSRTYHFKHTCFIELMSPEEVHPDELAEVVSQLEAISKCDVQAMNATLDYIDLYFREPK